ncbi:MAG: 50S ribosomal protein L3 [Candidatus Aminicenantes bacterium]|nr:50S ribosomal protein L3 [Candidatus Aminicenantes bacterium]MDH5714253.1 50S ribosomal protein L3 [Candidatus Aminicenantes bacterium]
MIEGLIGKKIGMTQLFSTNGEVVPVTVIKAGPCIVLQVKTKEKDGYEAVQLGLIEDEVKEKRLSKPLLGHLKKASAPPVRIIQEFKLLSSENAPVLGDKVTVNLLSDEKRVRITGISKGRGFAGVVKRWGFRGGKATRGSMFHRAPGSIGASAFPSRVLKGTRLPGRMGGRRVTVKNLEIANIEGDKDLLIVKGATPGPKGGYLLIRRLLSNGKAKERE